MTLHHNLAAAYDYLPLDTVDAAQVREVDLSGGAYSEEDLNEISRTLAKFPSLASLRVPNLIVNQPEAITPVFASIASQLQVLDLSQISFGKQGIVAVLDFVAAAIHLRQLQLNCVGLGETGAQGLARRFRCFSLEVLQLEDNSINDSGALALAKVLGQFDSLQQVSFYKNNLTSAGVQALVSSLLPHSQLQVIDLSDNKIGEAHSVLAEAFEVWDNLTDIKLSDCYLEYRAAHRLLQALSRSNVHLCTLDLSFNAFTELCDEILFLLETREELTKVDVQGNLFEGEAYRKFNEFNEHEANRGKLNY